MSVLYPQPPGFLFAARVFIWEALVLPRPGLMRTAQTPHNGDCVRPLNDRLSIHATWSPTPP